MTTLKQIIAILFFATLGAIALLLFLNEFAKYNNLVTNDLKVEVVSNFSVLGTAVSAARVTNIGQTDIVIKAVSVNGRDNCNISFVKNDFAASLGIPTTLPLPFTLHVGDFVGVGVVNCGVPLRWLFETNHGVEAYATTNGSN